MKAVLIERPGTMAMVDIDMPRPAPGEVAVRIAYIGYCGSDLNSYRGTNPLVSYPRVPGHEISGVIVETGQNVPPTLQPGQRVTILPYFNCGSCNACRMNRPNACKHNKTLGVQREGALTELVCVPYGKVVAVNGLETRALTLIEPLAVGFHAARRAEIVPEERVVVLGCGVIGLGAILGALSMGAHVIAVDLSRSKLDRAVRLGAHATIDAAQECVGRALQDMIGDDGPEVVIEAVGAEETFRQAVDIVASCGRVIYVGYAKNPVLYETRLFVMKEINIRGSRGALLSDFHDVIEYLKRNPAASDVIISRVVGLEDACSAMAEWSADPGALTKILVQLPEDVDGRA
jgi:2-desacetyl-2-hydroxyethyl bacteriochlorophyllide A dehydrogenase